MALPTIKRSARSLFTHFILLCGTVVFSFPFVWLITTSMKEETEIFRMPPQWLPSLPQSTRTSPYLSTRGLELIDRPVQCDQAKWGEVAQGIRATTQDRVTALAPAEYLSLFAEKGELPAGPAKGELIATASQAAWSIVAKRLPDVLWTGSEPQIREAVARAITPEIVNEALGQVVKRQMAGPVFVTDHEYAESRVEQQTPWQPAGGGGVTFPWKNVENPDPYTLLKYDFKKKAREVGYTSRLTLPFECEKLRQVGVNFKNNASCYEMDFLVRSHESAWRSQKPFIIDNDSFQQVNLTLTSDVDRNLNALMLKKTGEPGNPQLGPNEIELTFRIVRTPYWKAVINKFSHNFRLAFQLVPFWRYTAVSVYLVVMNIALMLLSCSLVAFAFSRLKWPGRDVIFMLAISTMMLPPQVTMIPVFLIIKKLGWYNTLKPLWVPAMFGSAFYIFLLRQFLMGLPHDLEDAARIDGCGYFGIYRNIALPLMKPALATIAIFQFMATWNDFMGPVLYVNSERLTPLSLGLFMFRAVHGGDFGLLMAASLLMTLPVIVIFFFAQRYFIQGITLTGMKG